MTDPDDNDVDIDTDQSFGFNLNGIYDVPTNLSYHYIAIPGKVAPPVFGKLFIYTIYGALESYLIAFRIPADVIKLVDGTVAYRMLDQYMVKLKSDGTGFYIDIGTFGRLRITDTDPTIAGAPIASRPDWVPVGNG